MHGFDEELPQKPNMFHTESPQNTTKSSVENTPATNPIIVARTSSHRTPPNPSPSKPQITSNHPSSHPRKSRPRNSQKT